MLVKNLSDAQSMAEIEQRICVDDHERNLKPVIAAMILADAGTTGLANFSKLIETFADPEVLKAIQVFRCLHPPCPFVRNDHTCRARV